MKKLIFIFIIFGFISVLFFVFKSFLNSKNEVVIEKQKMNTSSLLETPEPSFVPSPVSMLTLTPTIPVKVTPTPTIKITATPTPTISKTPSDNKNPKADILTASLNQIFTINDFVTLQIRATDDYAIQKVEIYINSSLKASITPNVFGGKDASGVDTDKQEEATKKISDYLKDEKEEETLYYAYRDYKEWPSKSAGCGISKGWVIIMHSKDTLYDMRISSDLETINICKEGPYLNYDDLYTYMFYPKKAGSYKVYAKAYDIYGKSYTTEEKTVKFE